MAMGYFRAVQKPLYILIMLLLAQLVAAQRYAFSNWGTDDGLPISAVNDLCQDPLGFVWIATDGGGLVQFDGQQFRNLPALDSLPSRFVTVLAQRTNGSFYIGTERGIAFYDGKNLQNFDAYPQSIKTRVNAILPVGDTAVWIATRNGLHFFDGKTFSQPVPQLADVEVNSLSLFYKKLVLSCSAGVFEVSKGVATKLPFDDFARVIQADSLTLLVNKTAVFQLHKDKTLSLIAPAPDVRDALFVNGQLWLATATNGILRIQPNAIETINANAGLQYDRCRSLLLGKNGQIWVGSLSGVSTLVTPHIFAYDAASGLIDNRIHTTLQAQDGSIWVGATTGVSHIYQGKIKNYSTAQGFPKGVVFSILQDAAGVVWFATERGLVKFEHLKFTIYDESNGLLDPFVFGVYSFKQQLFVGTSSGLFKKTAKGFEAVEVLNAPFGEGFVQLLAYGDTLFGVSLSGSVYALQNEVMVQRNSLFGLQIDTLQIHQMLPLGSHNVALSVSNTGIYILTKNKKILLDKRHGLQSVNINAIAQSAENFWVGTEQGLYALAISEIFDDPIFSFFGPESGFNAKECNERALYVGSNGRLYIGTNNGLFVAREKKFAQKKEQNIFIKSIALFFDENTSWRAFSESISPWNGLPNRLKLPFDQNYLTFKFGNGATGGQQKYVRYKLQGQDEEWTVARNRQEANYTNIQPGKFVFRVQSALRPDFKHAIEASIPVQIVPPYYRTWWFWAVVVLALGALVVVAVRYRINQLNRRLYLEAALADSERKALRLQMNPHFVFNALDAISGFIFKNEPKEAVHFLSSFAKLMRITLESSREPLVPLQSEMQLLKNYIELEQLRFSNSFDFNIEATEDLDPYEVMLPPMLLQPFVENAILHGLRHKKDGRGMLLVLFSKEKNQLVCQIQDDGVGRAASTELNKNLNKKSLATAIAKERIALLAKSRGEVVTFEIEDLYHKDLTAAGTKVSIHFPWQSQYDEA